MKVTRAKTLHPVEVISLAERSLWGERNKLLNHHKSYAVRSSYYPHNMDEWHEKETEICREYNMKIARLNHVRREIHRTRYESIHSLNKVDRDDYDSDATETDITPSMSQDTQDTQHTQNTQMYICRLKKFIRDQVQLLWY